MLDAFAAHINVDFQLVAFQNKVQLLYNTGPYLAPPSTASVRWQAT